MPAKRTPKRRRKAKPTVPSRLAQYYARKKQEAEAREIAINQLAQKLVTVGNSSVLIKLLSEIKQKREDQIRFNLMISEHSKVDPNYAQELRHDLVEIDKELKNRESRLEAEKASLRTLGPLGRTQLGLIEAIEKLIKEITP